MSKIREEEYKERKWDNEPRAREGWWKNQGRTVNGNTNLEPLAKHFSLTQTTHLSSQHRPRIHYSLSSLKVFATRSPMRNYGVKAGQPCGSGAMDLTQTFAVFLCLHKGQVSKDEMNGKWPTSVSCCGSSFNY